MTRRHLSKVIVTILIVATIVWAVSVFVLPPLPPPLNNWILVAALSVGGVAALFGAINGADLLFIRHFGSQTRQPRPTDGSTAMKPAIRLDTTQKPQLRILFVDDDENFRHTWALYLENVGYRVIQAGDSAEAYRIYSNGGVDLAVVDLRLLNDTERDYSGARLAQEMKAIPRIIMSVDDSGEAVEKAIGVIPSEGPPAFAYAFKKDGPDALVRKIQGVIEQTETIVQGVPPYRGSVEHRIILTCEPGRPVRIQISSPPGRETSSERNLELDERHFAEAADHLPGPDWQIGCKQLGKELFQRIFVSPGKVVERYSEMLGSGVPGDHLHLRFVGGRTLLGVPLECGFDATRGEGDFLVLHHPLSRSVLDTRSRCAPVDPDLFRSLRAENQELRILLIAAATRPPIPDVNEEVRHLQTSLPQAFVERGVRVSVETISGSQASYRGIRERLEKSHYHIVHYAGHSFFDPSSPQESGLLLWNGSRSKRGVELMRISAFAMHLQQAQVQFVYLSCCESARVGNSGRLVDNNLLGIADDIIHRGTPAVLGHRWLVPGQSAKELALVFYLSLAQTGQLDTALYHARRRLYGQNPADITWLSPVLAMQS